MEKEEEVKEGEDNNKDIVTIVELKIIEVVNVKIIISSREDKLEVQEELEEDLDIEKKQ